VRPRRAACCTPKGSRAKRAKFLVLRTARVRAPATQPMKGVAREGRGTSSAVLWSAPEVRKPRRRYLKPDPLSRMCRQVVGKPTLCSHRRHAILLVRYTLN
jgi:hypothetical protein